MSGRAWRPRRADATHEGENVNDPAGEENQEADWPGRVESQIPMKCRMTHAEGRMENSPSVRRNSGRVSASGEEGDEVVLDQDLERFLQGHRGDREFGDLIGGEFEEFEVGH